MEHSTEAEMQEVSNISDLLPDQAFVITDIAKWRIPKRGGLEFPPIPKDGDTHETYKYDASRSAWVKQPPVA